MKCVLRGVHAHDRVRSYPSRVWTHATSHILGDKADRTIYYPFRSSGLRPFNDRCLSFRRVCHLRIHRKFVLSHFASRFGLQTWVLVVAKAIYHHNVFMHAKQDSHTCQSLHILSGVPVNGDSIIQRKHDHWITQARFQFPLMLHDK